MSLERTLCCLACAVLLSACASEHPNAAVQTGPSMESVLSEADVAARAGQNDKAVQLLKSAAGAYPTDKQPWLRMAQLRFDHANYGEAIVGALEALQRDPDDKLAHSIVAVSGLRLSSKALADLSHKNNLSGTVRSEAQELARLLRTSLGEDVLVPPTSTRLVTRPPQAKKPGATPAPPNPKTPASNDPFGALK